MLWTPSRRQRKAPATLQKHGLPAERLTGHGHANDSPILKNSWDSCCLSKEIALHCQISFHCFLWSGWQWNWGQKKKKKNLHSRNAKPFEMSLLSWRLINVSSHVAHQMGAIWCIGKRFRLGMNGPWRAFWLLGLSFLSNTGGVCLDTL